MIFEYGLTWHHTTTMETIVNTKTPRDLGPLHALLTRGLPDWMDAKGFLRTHALAAYLGISYQALYKIFDRNRISPKRVKALVLLSEGKLTLDDFAEFM